MRRTDKPDIGRSGMVLASEITCWAYCPEEWRFQYGLGLEPENQAARNAGNRHHAWKALAERVAYAAISLCKTLVIIAVLLLVAL